MQRRSSPVGALAAVFPFALSLLAGCTFASELRPAPEEHTATAHASLVGAQDTFPVLAPAPPASAKRSEICATDDKGAKAAWHAWVAQKHGTVNTWTTAPDGSKTCRFCDLEGQTVSVAPRTVTTFEDSFLAHATIRQADDSDADVALVMKNVYAAGAHVAWRVNITGQSSDLRCLDVDGMTVVHHARSVDLSGASAPAIEVTASQDMRMSEPSTLGGVAFANIAGLRLRATGTVYLSGTMYGQWTLDGSHDIELSTYNLSFGSSTLSLADVSGRISNTGYLSFGETTVKGSTGALRIVHPEEVRLFTGTVWPVGKTGLFPDAQLSQVLLLEATLVTTPGEIWPAPGFEFASLLPLRGTRLPEGTDLTAASLRGARLDGFDFNGITLSKVVDGKVVGADMTGTHLSMARFNQQSIDGVRFVSADVRGANFIGATGAADFSNATAGVLPPHTDGNGSDLEIVTRFDNAKLASSVFKGAQLQKASFAGAGLAEATFDGATIVTGADFHDASFVRIPSSGDPIRNTTFGAIQKLHAVKLDRADLRGVDLSGADFGPSNGARSSLIGTFLCGATLSNAKLGGADLTTAWIDVTGTIDLPGGVRGPCAPATRDHASTVPPSGGMTDCPSGGRGAGDDGACTDGQWKIQGATPQTCTGPNTGEEGSACTLDCECASYLCGSNGKCS
ncbi:MAG: pentapeptide repeat-containing protein [Deltaproteobacteria bacterium]|nr:pentapeptide repeat-containing protein [Deltaproteobacteria bacterium]